MDKVSDFILSLQSGDYVITNEETLFPNGIYSIEIHIDKHEFQSIISHGIATAVVCNSTGNIIDVIGDKGIMPLLGDNMKYNLLKILRTGTRIVTPKKTLFQTILEKKKAII